MRRLWLEFHADESGPTATEYAVMMGLILMVCLFAIQSVGTTTSSVWGDNKSNLDIAWNAAS
ncbi:MAG TPA: Flp family type IVb pilin [Planctomycetia bacterium]|nr:Flp family type IVb pilin [Planctomycetia bacterium]